jgi:arsenite methyltransferase
VGAPRETVYEAKLAAARFEAISIEPTRVYDIEDARVLLTDKGIDVWTPSRRRWKQAHERFFIRAVKPRPLAK